MRRFETALQKIPHSIRDCSCLNIPDRRTRLSVALRHNLLSAVAFFVLSFIATGAPAMPAAPDAAATFIRLANLLPGQQDIAQLAQQLGYRETGQTEMDTDYIDITYSNAANQSHLTVALENTPIGTQFSVLLDIPQTDQTYADTLIAALQLNWSLPDTPQTQYLNTGTARNWIKDLPNGVAQITVRHDAMTTRLTSILSPRSPGAAQRCN